MPEIGKIDRWRARVGLRSSSQPPTPTSAAPEADEATAEAGPGAADAPVDEAGPGDDRSMQQQARHIAFAGIPSASTDPSLAADGQELSVIESVSPTSREALGFDTAPSTPDPPLRSPRRDSVTYQDDAAAVPGDGRGKESKPSVASARAIAAGAGAHEAAREAIRRSLSPILRSAEAKQQDSPTSDRKKSLGASSPDESCSDEFHSPSPPSTPATSRSESEKGLLKLGDGTKALTIDTSTKDYAPTTESTGDGANDDLKSEVLECYRKARAESFMLDAAEPPLVVNRSLLPVATHQPVTTHPPGATRDTRADRRFSSPTSPTSPSWRLLRPISPKPAAAAASYLKEARRLPPAAHAPRGAKQRLGPPASFTLPGDLPSPATTRSDGSRPLDASQHLPHLASLGVLSDRDPLAKMFVECCRCRFYHDMPSSLYEAMANPESALGGREKLGYAGSISMTVKCPWCKHDMSNKCCAGLAALVYVTERLH